MSVFPEKLSNESIEEDVKIIIRNMEFFIENRSYDYFLYFSILQLKDLLNKVKNE